MPRVALVGALATTSSHAFAQAAADYRLVRVTDTVVANTDSTLQSTDQGTDQECSIAVNPSNANQAVVLGFSDNINGVASTASLWQTTNSGQAWTRYSTIPRPPGQPSFTITGDQTLDWTRGGALAITELAFVPFFGFTNVATGFTTDPTSAAAFSYDTPGGVTQWTNGLNAPSNNFSDQPWLLVNADPTTPSQDDTYVAYDDDSSGDVHVAVSYGVSPPNFTVDKKVGSSTGGGFVNQGMRIAKDTVSGAMYAAWQNCTANCATFGATKTIQYFMNRSTDGGHTWSLGGSATGAVVATASSDQPGKFGTVNALFGGVDHLAVSPKDGSVYYVYGSRDALSGNNRLALRRLVVNSGGTVTSGPESFVTGQVQAALPQVAVDSAGIVGVFYYTADGISGGLPTFTAHVAVSDDQGATFRTSTLTSFSSPVADDGTQRQRILGDFEQMKALGTCFYGAFAANGFALGRTVSAASVANNMDPAFFQVCGDRLEPFTQIVGSATALPLPAGNVSITGYFGTDNPVALNTSTITLRQVLHDSAGEHAQGIPLTLNPLPGGSPTSASYLSIVAPTVAMQITQLPLLGNFVQLNIAVDGVTLPPSCGFLLGSASLTTQFKIDDGVDLPVLVTGTANYGCAGPALVSL